jgi:HTH-type transcriptional regulator, glycine betaine synthesis regulator
MAIDAHPDEESGPGETLWESERIVSDTIGRLMEVWGFKRNMGRVWTVLYLAGQPLTAKQLRERLQLSSGAVSMTLNELARWGVVRKSWVQGDRRDFFEAEANVWKMVSRVMREREQNEISQAIDAFEEALVALDHQVEDSGTADPARMEVQRDRIARLIDLAKLGRSMLDALISNARLDASWLQRFRLGRR